MAHTHNWQHQVGNAVSKSVGFIKSFAETAASVKGIIETGIFIKNTLAPIAAVAAIV
jgi:hypothetical protein